MIGGAAGEVGLRPVGQPSTEVGRTVEAIWSESVRGRVDSTQFGDEAEAERIGLELRSGAGSR